MRTVTGRVLIVTLAALLFGACGSKPATEEELPASTLDFPTTTTTADPWAIPQTIDAEYVRRVLQLQADIHGEVRRSVYASHEFTDVDRKKIESIYTGHYLGFALNEWPSLAIVNHSDVQKNPASSSVSVQQVLAASSQCILVNAKFNDSAALIVDQEPMQAQLVLVFAPHDRSINPSPWMTEQFTIPGRLSKVDACNYEQSQ